MTASPGDATGSSAGECCDLHGRNCELDDPCCEDCTEVRHGGWTDERGHWRYGHPAGERCASPVFSRRDPDYIVLRAWPQAPPGWLPPGMDGCWFDRSAWPAGGAYAFSLPVHAIVQPAGRFEFRNGACAEVWEVSPSEPA